MAFKQILRPLLKGDFPLINYPLNARTSPVSRVAGRRINLMLLVVLFALPNPPLRVYI